MPNIQIKNVPEEVHKVWKHRAVAAGQSLQEYLLALLQDQASQPTVEELFGEIKARPDSGIRVSFDDVVRVIHEERSAR